MFESPPIARMCAAIGDPVRAAMLVTLIDGRTLTACACVSGELGAQIAN